MKEISRFKTYKEMVQYYKEIEQLIKSVSSGNYVYNETSGMWPFLKEYYYGGPMQEAREIKKNTGQSLTDSEIREIREKWLAYAQYIFNIYEEILESEKEELIPWIDYEETWYSKMKRAFNKECKNIVENEEHVSIIKKALKETTGKDYSEVEAFRKSLCGVKKGDVDVLYSVDFDIRYNVLVSYGFPTKLLPIEAFEHPKDLIKEYACSGDFILLGDYPFQSKDYDKIGSYEFFGMPTETYEKLNEKIYSRLRTI